MAHEIRACHAGGNSVTLRARGVVQRGKCGGLLREGGCTHYCERGSMKDETPAL
ncbi:hypothetical protein B0H12DRAFT_1152537 [Mycena haematopus]|nr:hypothetical protein B0H12DRAFT_1152537 [Mycena haematopus]